MRQQRAGRGFLDDAHSPSLCVLSDSWPAIFPQLKHWQQLIPKEEKDVVLISDGVKREPCPRKSMHSVTESIMRHETHKHTPTGHSDVKN